VLARAEAVTTPKSGSEEVVAYEELIALIT